MAIPRYALTVSVLFLSFCALVRGGVVLSSSSGGFSLAWTAADIRITRAGNAAQQISFRRLAQAEWNKLTQGVAGESLHFETTYRVLSFVGPYLSVEVGDFCDCGGAHPTALRHFQAIDLRGTGPEHAKPLMMTELFPEKAILAALKADRVISATLKRAQASSPQSLSAMVDAVKYESVQIGECGYSLSDNFLNQFALYDFTADKVAVRISLSHAAEVCRGQMTQIGIKLPVPEGLRQALREAKAKLSGFLMSDAPKLAGNKETSFDFSAEGDPGGK